MFLQIFKTYMDIKYQINMQMNYFLTLEKPVNINSADICIFLYQRGYSTGTGTLVIVPASVL